ncbi:MAG: transglycosylase SLT domain-containing protein [Usitatibacter sp.]
MALTCIKLVKAATCAAIIAAAPHFAFAAAADTDLLTLKDAAQKGNWRVLDQLRPRFSGHPLEAYPTYWLLSGQLAHTDPAEVRAFLARYPDSPLSETLRRDWLKSLAVAGNWTVFRAEHPSLVSDDAEIACYALQDRIARGDAEAQVEARALFNSPRETPVNCDSVFAPLADAKWISNEDIWERARRLLAANQVKEARRVIALLPKAQLINEKSLDRAAAEPSAFLARESRERPTLMARGPRELVLFAIIRLARSKPEEAAERLAAFAPRLGSTTAEFAWGHVALQAAMSHQPRALDYYAMAKDAALTEAQIAWKARAGLRTGNWKLVLAAIQAMAPQEARDPTWRYWRARALRQLGENEASAALMKGLAHEITFYGLLAAEELQLPVTLDWNVAPPTAQDLERIRARPGVQRALLLYSIGLGNEALREWIWTLRGLDDRELLAAAEAARQANEPDRAINTADKTVQIHDFTQRYPIPHRETLAASARQWDLDEAIVYSIIRQESRFIADVRSRVGATGLMQLMPATARWVAKQIPIASYSQDMLTQPEVNIRMGTYYFRRVLDDLGHPLLATAAYNAGPGRARRWRDERPLEGAIYAETIPFSETRDYVKKVFANAWFYRHRLTGKNGSLHQLLGTVPGRTSEPAGTVATNAIP